ncbi:MAG: RIP metalloprotease RseP, partial [Gammaproteobacteria bacterium]|nr:RIP metalloprotease RseP [Gammaproteobacteria bacterium]
MNILISIIAFVVAICVLIIWHEFGHFIVMRLFGIKVLRFSVFFGKPLFRWQRRPGSTELAIGWLPLGGYVKPLDEHDGDVADSEKHLAFNRQSLYKRFLAVLAGPAFNFLFAILAYWAIFIIGIPGTRPVIGDVRPDSPAAHAGFVKQDVILSVNGSDTPTWEMAGLRLFEGSIHSHTIAVRVLTPDHHEKHLLLSIKNSRSLTEPGKLLEGLGLSQWQPQAAPEIYKILPGSSAEQAGLKFGDIIEKVDGVPITGPDQLIRILQAAPNKVLKVQILRGTNTLQLKLPVGVQKSSNGGVIGHIGAQIGNSKSILRKMLVEQRYNPLAALGQG